MGLRTGKNSKIGYYVKSYFHLGVPRIVLRLRKKNLLKNVEKRADWETICQRVNYYCKNLDAASTDQTLWKEKAVCLHDQKIKHPKVYYLDTVRYARYFDQHLSWHICHGDVNYIPELPSICKSRPIAGNNANATLMNMDRVRHFVFLHDSIKWKEKKDQVIFRGAIGQMEGTAFKQNRYLFMQKFFGHAMVDAGEVMEGGKYINEEWAKPKITLYDHLEYKFVMALEGNDVASNLKWIMSSNSIAVMPKPRFETWFMEGTLVGDYHYIEVKDDYSDLEEKLNYYIEHPEKAEAIIQHAHEYVKQFQNNRREAIVSLLVLDKYFKQTNPVASK